MSNTAPVITYARHRMLCDGDGITTLVILYGCPLRCRYCINSFSFDPDTKRIEMTPQQLYDKVKIDDLYFLATGGGVTFGGGEPLMYPDFISDFKKICPDSWRICVETSLFVPWKNVEKVVACVDTFYVDCKDADAVIYREYTGKDNQLMRDNLQKLIEVIPKEKIILRLPLIPLYNTENDRKKSRRFFEQYGFTRFNEFTYQVQE